jgi:hypothetical protein
VKHQGGERIELVLMAQPSDVPTWPRVRGALKCLLRTFGLRCVSVRDVTPQLPAGPPGVAQNGPGSQPTTDTS